ncbi:MAG TPA: hypothetical protein VJT68_06740 [Thermoleophilaceae bacterium]|nr:hypothetical protein [Thermoleophilaceae bacterium]
MIADAALVELVRLLPETDSVELKLTIPESRHLSVARALGLDPIDAQIRQVFFFDTPELALDRHGVVVRARRIQGKGADAVVKLRPLDPGDVRPALRASQRFTVEVDAVPGGFVCSGTLKRAVDSAEVRGVAAGERPLSSLLSKRQRALATEHGPDGLALDGLRVLGPILVLKLKFEPEDLGRRMVAELWLYPDGSRVLELSTKCMPDEAFQVAAEARAYLAARGVDTSGDQETKTKKALEFFAAAIRSEDRVEPGGADC